jgi:hypothetical protein
LNVSGVTIGTIEPSFAFGMMTPEAFAPSRHSPWTSRARYGNR